VEQIHDYFPGANEVPKEGAWILVKTPPPCEYTVPPLSMWFATPWDMKRERNNSHRVRIVTPRGDLGLFPREYSIVKNPEKYHEFLGQGMELQFFGGVDGVPADQLFYLRSRGISKRDAIAMLLGNIRAHGVCWIETSRELCATFGMEWPEENRLATVQ
jgi:hypothetical protein